MANTENAHQAVFRKPRHGPSSGWDLCAASLSTACIFHCLGLPLVASLIPVAFQAVDGYWVHLALVVLAAPVTFFVIWRTVPGKGSGLFAMVALSGLGLMMAAVTVGALEAYEVPLTLAGGTLLGGAHLWRWVRHQILSDASALSEHGNG